MAVGLIDSEGVINSHILQAIPGDLSRSFHPDIEKFQEGRSKGRICGSVCGPFCEDLVRGWSVVGESSKWPNMNG